MKFSLLAVGIPVCVILFISMVGLAREKTLWRFVQLLGAVALLVVVFTHIAEAFHLFPSMNWGQSDSAGHYLDLASAISGMVLLPAGYLFRVLSHPHRGVHANGH